VHTSPGGCGGVVWCVCGIGGTLSQSPGSSFPGSFAGHLAFVNFEALFPECVFNTISSRKKARWAVIRLLAATRLSRRDGDRTQLEPIAIHFVMRHQPSRVRWRGLFLFFNIYCYCLLFSCYWPFEDICPPATKLHKKK
jgi:hypothetical protein